MQEDTATTKTYALSQGGCLLPAVMSLAGCPGWDRLSLSLPSVRTRMRSPDLRWSWLASSSPALFHVRNWKITDTLSSPDAPGRTKWLLELRKVTGTVCVCEQEKDTFPCEHSETGFRKAQSECFHFTDNRFSKTYWISYQQFSNLGFLKWGFPIKLKSRFTLWVLWSTVQGLPW